MRLALREIRRAKLRFGLLTGAVALLVFLILFMQSIFAALVTGFIGAVRNQDATVLVYNDQARKNLEGSRVTPAQLDAIAAVPGVAEAGPLGEGTFTVTAGGQLRDATLFGYRLGGPGRPTSLTSGRLPTADGEGVASDADTSKGFHIGDRIRVEPGGTEITIVGLGKDLQYSVNPTVFISFTTFQQARRAANPDAKDVYPSAAAVHVAAGTSPSSVAKAIQAAVPGIQALTRQQAVDESPGVQSVNQSLSVVLLLAFIVVVLVTGFFFLILTVQKAGALTLLRAIGAPTSRLTVALLAQVLLVTGGGLVLATALLAVSTQFGGSVRASVDAGPVLESGVLVLVLAVIASLGAIRRVVRLEPAQATAAGGGV